MTRIGVIGCGYWGPNLIRNLTKVTGCKLVAVADQRPERLEAVKHLNPGMSVTTAARELVESDSIDGIVIATPISTHFELAKACLTHGKHVLIEKPMTTNVADARQLIHLEQENIAYVNVELEGGTLAHFHLNWLSPVKLRRTLIGGSRRMVMYDHLDSDNQLKIFDKGVEILEDHDRYKVLVQYRTGDLLVPKVDQTEALESACRHFIHCIQTGEKPITDGHAGLRVVELLQAADQSIKKVKKEDVNAWAFQAIGA